MKIGCFNLTVLALLVITMFGCDGYGVKCKANGNLRRSRAKGKANGKVRRSRATLLRELKPAWWVDACTRKALGNLLGLDDGSSIWVDHVRSNISAGYGRYYICSKCGNSGAHVISMDAKGGLHYRCSECGGKGIATHGGIAAMFDIGSGCRYDANWESTELLEEYAGSGTPGNFDMDGFCEHNCESDSCACGGHYGDQICEHHCNGSQNVDAADLDADEESDDSSWDPHYLPGGNEEMAGDDLVDSVNESDGDDMDVDSIGDISSGSDDVHNDEDVDIPTKVKFYEDACDNCHRKSIEQRNSSGRIDCDRTVRLRVVWLTSGAFLRRASTMKYKTARAAAMEVNPGYCKQNSVRMQLCQQCRNGLTIQPSTIVEKDIWPALIWTWLTDRSLLRRFGSDLWKIIPAEWRPWWIRAALDCIPQFHNVTADNPLPIFLDVTDRKKEFEEGIADMRASEMQRVCNHHLLPLVRCPWGCSEYFHKCNTLSIDLVVRKIFGSAVTPVFGGEKYARDGISKMEGLNRDYVDVCHAPCLLGNKAWRVLPSIAFIDGIPRVLSCRNHGNGSKGKCFYPPRNPNGVLSSKVEDQVAPAVVRPRTVRQFKPHTYSDTFQMSEMQGQFAGVDTFHLTTKHNFESESILLQDNEALAMSGRKDIFSLVTEWADPRSKVLPSGVAENMIRDAEGTALSDDALQECCQSATYVTLSDAVKLYKANKECKGRIARIKVKGEMVDSHYIPQWPSVAIHVHPFNHWGCEFPLLIDMQQPEDDCHLLWSLSAMMIGVPSLWEKTDAIVCNCEDWHGWLLAYLTPVCFPQHAKLGRNSPFKYRNGAFTKKRLEELLIRMGMKVNPIEEADDGGSESGGSSRENGSETHMELDSVEGRSILSLDSALRSLNALSSLSDIEGAFSDGEESFNVPNGSSQVRDVVVEIDGALMDAENDQDGDRDAQSILSLGSLEDSNKISSVLHTDGCFHAEDIHAFMASFKDVEVVSDVELLKEGFMVKESSHILVVFSSDGQHHFPSESVVGTDGITLELRFVSGRELYKKGSSEFAFMRHGGAALTNWWVQK